MLKMPEKQSSQLLHLCIRRNREQQRVADRQLNNRLMSRRAGICHSTNEGQEKTPAYFKE